MLGSVIFLYLVINTYVEIITICKFSVSRELNFQKPLWRLVGNSGRYNFIAVLRKTTRNDQILRLVDNVSHDH